MVKAFSLLIACAISMSVAQAQDRLTTQTIPVQTTPRADMYVSGTGSNNITFGTTTYTCRTGSLTYSSSTPCPSEWDVVINQLEKHRDALTMTIDMLKKEKTR